MLFGELGDLAFFAGFTKGCLIRQFWSLCQA
jgi:hypothetical protein